MNRSEIIDKNLNAIRINIQNHESGRFKDNKDVTRFIVCDSIDRVNIILNNLLPTERDEMKLHDEEMTRMRQGYGFTSGSVLWNGKWTNIGDLSKYYHTAAWKLAKLVADGKFEVK